MCGLAGCFGHGDETTIRRMLKTLGHRGPDDQGAYCKRNLVFGHTRLSIVDVTHGRQPMVADEGRAGVVCNGEIYNFLTLKKNLSRKYGFTTRSDTETLLHLYREKGPECVKDLDGMFAFAVFNGDDYMLARDPIGIKPLYYAFQDDRLYFSSELGAMMAVGLDNVCEFQPGHYYTPGQGFVKYYRLPEADGALLTDVEEIVSRLRDTLMEAVRKRLLADNEVPVGSFCSGGLDSSLVASLASRDIPCLHTFAVGMQDSDGEVSDDIKAARIVADHIGSNHHERIFTEEEYYEALPTVIRKLESYDPALVRGAVPNYFTCEAASRYVTVVLTGEGADEQFAGYHYMKHFPENQLNREARRCIGNLHNIDLQRADRMGMIFGLELRVPFLDAAMVDLSMQIPPDLKIREHEGHKIEKWILRKAFQDTGLLPEDILWRYKVQYSQGAGCQHLGERLAEKEMTDAEVERVKAENPKAEINSKEAAYYFKIFRKYFPNDTYLKCIGIWKGFDFAEERERVRGTVDGDRKPAHHKRKEKETNAEAS